MASKERTVLIVEDEPDFQHLLKLACTMASERLEERLRAGRLSLPEDGLFAPGEPIGISHVILAADEAQAGSILEDRPRLDFVSVDLALARDEYGRSEIDDSDGSVGGLRLLRTLNTWERRPLAAVVSGEQAQSYSIEATLALKVFGFIPKHHFDIKNYSRLITAACLYQEASDIIAAVKALELDPDNLEVARRCWVAAQEVVAADAGQELKAIPVNFPEPLDHSIEASIAELDRTTRRPTGEAIKRALRRQIVGKQDWTLLRVQLTDYAGFRSAHASEVDALRLLVTQAIKSTVKSYQRDAFLGVLSAELAPDPCFLVILKGVIEGDSRTAIEETIINTYHEGNVGLLTYGERATFLQQLRDSGQAVSRDRDSQNKIFQQRLPQPAFTWWDSENTNAGELFPDVAQAIDTLTQPSVDSRGKHLP